MGVAQETAVLQNRHVGRPHVSIFFFLCIIIIFYQYIENYYFLTLTYISNFFFLFPADNSHICKIAANYLGDHTTNAQPFGGPDQPMSCDTIVDQVLQGNDFSSAYDCSQKSDDLKIKINLVASKCCGGNDGAPKSTCPPRECNFLFFFDLEIFYFLVPVISNSFSSFSCFSFPS